jgi:hypothetical protein
MVLSQSSRIGAVFLRICLPQSKEYQGKEHFFRIRKTELDCFELSTADLYTENNPNEYILFEIDKRNLECDFLGACRENPTFLFSSLDATQRLLLVSTTIDEHAVAIGAFRFEIEAQVDRM